MGCRTESETHNGCGPTRAVTCGDELPPGVDATDINGADWLEMIQAERHEMPDRCRTMSSRDCDWMADPIVSEELVVFLAIECLKRARYHASGLAN